MELAAAADADVAEAQLGAVGEREPVYGPAARDTPGVEEAA